MGSILSDSLMKRVSELSVEGKRALAAELRRMVAEELAPEHDGACPRCGCAAVVRKGHGRDGSQRWLCRGCGRTFCARTMSVAGQSRLPKGVWMAFAEGMADGLTLRDLAERCSVCLKTSWFMRMRMCEAMARHPDAFRSGPGISVEVDGTMLHESLSGNASRGPFSMPRKPRRSYHGLHVRGVSGQLACVVCGANDRGDCFCELVGRAHADSEAIRCALEGRIAAGTTVATDDLPAYDGALAAIPCGHEVRPSGGTAKLGMVNALHKRLADFLRPFNGVATRRLQRYLWWFCWVEQFRHGDADRRELVCGEASSGIYSTTIREAFHEPRFLMGYWEKRGWQATGTAVRVN